MSILRRHLLPFILSLALIPLAQAFEPARITLEPSDDGEPMVEVTGTWPDTCTPLLQSASFEGSELRLLAQREQVGCQPTPTPYGFSVPTPDLGVVPAILRVRLLVGDDLQGAPALAGFALLGTGAPGSGTALESGFWWAEQGGPFGAGPGLGLSIETQGSQVSLSVMGYDGHGAATWYFGAGELDRNTALLELGRFEGGAGPFATYAAPASVELAGRVAIEVLTPSRATLWFLRDHEDRLEARPLSIMRFHFAQEPGAALLGRWIITGDDAGARDTRWIELVRSEAVSDGFVLHDSQGQAALQCDTPSGQPGSPPILCRFDDGQGDLVEFVDVALRRMSGWDVRGQRTLAFRLD